MDRPDAIIDPTPGTLQAVVFAGPALDDAIGSGDLRVRGDRLAAERSRRLLPRRRVQISRTAGADSDERRELRLHRTARAKTLGEHHHG